MHPTHPTVTPVFRRYGFRLKEFEDDPVKIADKDASEPATNPIVQWFQALDSPLNDGSGWGNPLKRS